MKFPGRSLGKLLKFPGRSLGKLSCKRPDKPDPPDSYNSMGQVTEFTTAKSGKASVSFMLDEFDDELPDVLEYLIKNPQLLGISIEPINNG